MREGGREGEGGREEKEITVCPKFVSITESFIDHELHL